MYWELRCCGGKSHILTIQHRISNIAENSLVKLGIWLPYNSSLSRPMQPRQTYSPGFTNGRTDRKLLQAINPSAAMLRSGLKNRSMRMISSAMKMCQNKGKFTNGTYRPGGHCWKNFTGTLSSFNSLWHSDVICRHRSGSTLAQVMACFLTAPSHYLNQCWRRTSEV